MSAPEYYHCFHDVVGPSDLSWSLTSCHTLPVLVNEWYDILQREIKTIDKLKAVMLRGQAAVNLNVRI